MDELTLRETVTTVLDGAHRDVDMQPWERVAQANQMALEAAKDPYIRSAAVQILKGCRDVRNKGGEWIARWIRKNVTYAEEALGVEVLQGPFATLALRHGDCDDLSLTWAALARSVGLDAYVAGVARKDSPDVLVHAVGYDNGTGKHWELSKDHRWGGARNQPLAFKCPSEYLTVWWSPEDHRKGYWVDEGSGYRARKQQSEQETMRYRNPYDAKGQWYDEAPANGATGKTSSPLPGADDDGGPGTTILSGLAEGLGSFFSGIGAQAPGALLGTDEGLATPPDEPEYAVLPPEQRQGMPTWVWGLLGLGAVGGLVWYAVKQ